MRPTSRLLPIRERGHVGRGYDACEAAGGALAPSVEPNQSWDVSTCSFYSSSVPLYADGTVDREASRSACAGWAASSMLAVGSQRGRNIPRVFRRRATTTTVPQSGGVIWAIDHFNLLTFPFRVNGVLRKGSPCTCHGPVAHSTMLSSISMHPAPVFTR